MKVTIVGTDPAGLYLATRLRSRQPTAEVRILDTGSPGRAVATPHLMANPVKPELKLADAAIEAEILGAAVSTRGLRLARDGEEVRTTAQPYTIIPAAALATILRRRAEALGCAFVTSDAQTAADLVVIADGAESFTRGSIAEAFKPRLVPARTRYVMFDIAAPAATPGFLFRRTPHGIFHAFHYPASASASVLIVEAQGTAIAAAGLADATPAEITAFASQLFGADLAGAALGQPRTGWRKFTSVTNATWTAGNAVLLGAAAYNAHVSVGLGARSGLEDAEALATFIHASTSAQDALRKFEAARRPRAESLQRAAGASLVWFENVHRYIDFDLPQLAYSCLTRTMRLNHESMHALAPELTDRVENTIAGGAVTKANRPPPPMFTPITLRGLTIPNRVVMSPMCMYNADDGTVGDFHLVHYGSRAVGGTGLVITEMTDVSPEGRISNGCAGLYKPEHVAAWRRVTDFVHKKSQAKIGVQLGHAGRKGAEPRPWERAAHKGGPLWQTIAPSALPFQQGGPAPREVTRADMDRLIAAYANATRMAHEAGFDLIELHFAHGYLLSTFVSPLANQRTDRYGGTLANRLRFPMEVFEAVRAAWPADKPISVRISAVDWIEGGTSLEDAIEIGRRLKDAGNDILSVSTGGVTSGPRPAAGRLYQATFSDQVRNELKIRTMTVGGVASHGDINMMIAGGRADMCAMARGHLFDPYFTRHAAYQQDYADLAWPDEYERVTSLEMRDF